MVVLPLLLALACNTTTTIGGAEPVGTDSGAVDTAGEAELPGDTSVDSGEPEDTAPEVESWPKPCSDLYDPEVLPTFELDFEPEDWSALRADCSTGTQRYRDVTFTYAGESVAAQVRLKGNWSWSCDKLQFVVSFNETDPEGRFHGQRKLVLDAPWYDRTLLHERIAFPIFAARGLPYSCVNNARVIVDGEYYGLYANTERIDHEYLERNFEAFEGNLYQGGAELKTNEDIGDVADLDALHAATSVEELEAMIDLDEAVAEWAVEAMIPAMDNFWAGVEINYYLYDHPTRGFVYLPYDLDLSFGDSAYESGELVWPDTVTSDPITYEHPGWRKEPVAKLVLADPFWCERFVEELVLARAAYDPEALADEIDFANAQIADAYRDDPHTPYSLAQHEAALGDLKEFLPARAEFVDAWLAEGGHCPARF